MERKNIPSYVLAKGISKEGFDVLLDSIKVAALEDGVNKFNNCNKLIDEVKQKENGVISQEEIDQWVADFEEQLKESSDVIKDNMNQIEALFNRMFEDWEKYKLEHGIVEKTEEAPIDEKTEEVVNQEETKTTTENTDAVVQEEEKTEEVVQTFEVESEEKTKETKKEKKSRKKKEVVTEGDNNE